MTLFNFFKTKVSDTKIIEKLGESLNIRNGIGYGFISDEYLYDNTYLELGFGRSISGYGDWGDGFDHASTSPLKITIDKDFIIRKMETDSFYNSKSSQDKEVIAKKIMSKLSIGKPLLINDEQLKKDLNSLFNYMPAKSHIGWDYFKAPHMLEHFTENKNYYERKIRDQKK